MMSRQTTPQKQSGSQKKSGGAPNNAAASVQSTRGNGAANEKNLGAQASPGIGNEEAMSWLQETEAEVPRHKQRGPADASASRPSKVNNRMKGALIGDGSPIPLSSAEKEGKEVAKVPDGSAVEVISSGAGRIKVKVRSGDKNVEGWCDASLLSDQPALTRDEENTKVADNYVYSKFEGDQSPKAPKGKDTAQGYAGDCFLIASMAAVANANPDTIREAITYNPEKKNYTVRFHEEVGKGKFKPVFITVDGFLPTSADNRQDPSYAGDKGGPMWSAIMEKAYAKWKGGYDVINEGGYGDQAMAEITGNSSVPTNPASLKEDQVVPFFQKAQKEKKAIYAGVIDAGKSDVQHPFSGTGSGPLKASIKQAHQWNHINPGSVSISDEKGKAGSARDNGKEGDKTGKLSGKNVSGGSVDYKGSAAEITFKNGLGPADPKDLALNFTFEGVVNNAKMIIGNHAYAFEGVVDGGLLQFYNPWGSYQPKPITPAEFLTYFNSLAVNAAPSGTTKGK